jgi:predicted O-methyltransferase YrrM
MIDFVYIDGNHRYEPTMKYFDLLMQYSHEGTILVSDDIHWSLEMTQAWKAIEKDQLASHLPLTFIDWGLHLCIAKS